MTLPLNYLKNKELRMKIYYLINESVLGHDMGAGILPVSKKTGKILIQKRGRNIDYPNQWATFGGKGEDGESPEQTAKREFKEESGYSGKLSKFQKLDVQRKKKFVFHNFIALVDDDFKVSTINKKTDAGHIEVQDAKWLSLDELESFSGRLHYGLKRLLRSANKNKIKKYIEQNTDKSTINESEKFSVSEAKKQ